MNLAKLTAKIVGKKYELGKVDCFKFVIDYLNDAGADMPHAFEDVTMDTYAELFLKDPSKAKRIMLRYMQKHTEEIDVVKSFAGDILLVRIRKEKAFPTLAINGGNGIILIANEKQGILSAHKKHFKVLGAFRCHKQSH